MTSTLARREPGGLGIEPLWTHGAKVAVGTARHSSVMSDGTLLLKSSLMAFSPAVRSLTSN